MRKRQFCLNGHDTFVVGRGRRSNCNACTRSTIETIHRTNIEGYRTYRKDRSKRLTETSPLFKLAKNLRKRTWAALKAKGFERLQHYDEYIGCTPQELQVHIEKQFQLGMNWSNQGEWHTDHIIPLASAKTLEELYKLCHYSNLQPLWAKDNLSKH